jgi:outer membrane protein assembly factor BamB
MYRSDPSHSGAGTSNPNGNNVLEPTELWQTYLQFPQSLVTVTTVPALEVPGFVPWEARSITDPVVVDGVVYISASSETTWGVIFLNSWFDIYAFNASDRSEIWDYRDTSVGDRVSPLAVAYGLVYFNLDSTGVYALNATSGKLFWSTPIDAITNSAPTVANGAVYISGRGLICALAASNGSKIWETQVNFGLSSPAVSNNTVYVGADTEFNGVFAFDANTGSQIWNFTDGDEFQSPVIDQGRVFEIVSENTYVANIYALNAIDGVRLWNYSMPSPWVIGGDAFFAVGNGVIYVGNSYDGVIALDDVNGHKLWETTIGSSSISGPTIVGNVVYLGTDTGLCAINAQNGRILWKYNSTSGSHDPVVVSGVAYVVSGVASPNSSQQLYAIALPAEPLPESSAAIPDLLWLIIVPLILSIFSVAVILRHRKTASLKPESAR